MTEPTPTGPKYRVEMWDDNGRKVVDFEEQGRWDGSVAPPVTLAEFLRARLDEDEAAARQKVEQRRAKALASAAGFGVAYLMFGGPFDPTRVLAEVEAKRRIVLLHESTEVQDHVWFGCTCGFANHRRAECKACGSTTYDEGDLERPYGPCPTLRLLALPYAGHSAYRSEWAP